MFEFQQSSSQSTQWFLPTHFFQSALFPEKMILGNLLDLDTWLTMVKCSSYWQACFFICYVALVGDAKKSFETSNIVVSANLQFFLYFNCSAV